MLTIIIPGDELWDNDTERFTYTDDVVLEFEHSLVSLSKWEAKFHKLFLSNTEPSEEEQIGYVEAMLVTPGIPRETLLRLTEDDVERIGAYINDPMTATTVSEIQQNQPKSSERISSELVYFWMSQYQIDKECEHWHLNRLFTLIKVHHAKLQKPQKMNKQKQIQSMAELNAARRAKTGSKG